MFFAWMHGQVRWRELPGVAVGVVADQELVWVHGFGFADIAAERPMTDWTNGHGIAFSVQRVDGTLCVGHGGGCPGYTTNTQIQLDSKVGVIVLTNTNDSSPSQIAAQLMNTVGSAVAQATKTAPDVVAWDPP